MMVFVFIMMGGTAVAQENGASWRGTYDTVMMWINFFILVFLFIKFAKNPLKNYLKSQQNEVAEVINGLEEKRNNLIEELNTTHANLEKSRIRLDEIKNRIITQGEHKKQSIIENATEQSHLMIEDAKKKIEAQILMAKTGFREELIDAAVDLALKKIPGYITETDNENYVQAYLAAAGGK
jgi:F-type H+-transporting ATPase subunit b